MARLDKLDSLVAKQLTKLGLSPDSAPDLASWQQFLARVSNHYKHADDDRKLLTRSLELSSSEMNQLQARLTDEHGRLRQLIAAISEGLRGFHEVVGRLPTSTSDDEVNHATSTIHYAKERLSTKLAELLAEDGVSSWSREEAEHIRHEFSFMADQLLELVQMTAQRVGLEKDLEVARAVQHMLVPDMQVIERPQIRLAGLFQPAAQCGGDWWSTYDLEGDQLLVLIGDVTGHGVAPAIITGVAKASCDVALLLLGAKATAVEVLRILNRCIRAAARQTLFMTCMASVFDPATRTVTVVNAGHPFPYVLCRQGSAGQKHKLKRLIGTGNPLGMDEEVVLRPVSATLEDGDIVLWFTDGLTETVNDQGEQFGERRLRHALEHTAGSDPASIRDSIMGEISAFRGTMESPDDVTMIVACVGA